MSINLLDSVRGVFSNELIDKIAASFFESKDGIHKAVNTAIPTLLAGVLNKTGTTEGAADILSMAKQAATSSSLENLGSFFNGNSSMLVVKGASMLNAIFGDKLTEITNLISSNAGVKKSSVSSLMSVLAPVAFDILGKHAIENNLKTGGIMNFLYSQRNSIINALPPGLHTFPNLLGFDASGNTIKSKVSEMSPAATSHYSSTGTEKLSNGIKFVVAIFLALFLAGLGIYLVKIWEDNAKSDNIPITTAETSILKGGDTVALPAIPAAIKVKLPNGMELEAYKGGIEDKLVNFLETDFAKLGADSLKKIWFDFDHLNFKTGSAELTIESQNQINNIAAILKAFPAIKLKIGGYTDKTGNEESNKKLSDTRAKAVKAALDQQGIEMQITDAEGYGSAFAKYSADAPETDRVRDRHVSVSPRL